MPDAALDLPFHNRRSAGRALGRALLPRAAGAVVLGVPRGGVIVADEVAVALGAELDVVVAKKIGAPGQPELALGAVSASGAVFLNDELVRMLGVPQDWLDGQVAAQQRSAEQRDRMLHRVRPRVPLAGRTAIIVDDGVATGATLRAAVRAARAEHPATVIVAVPVGSADACAGLRIDADDVVCLYEPGDFGAVGLYYVDFLPVSDDDVRRVLAARAAAAVPAG